MTEVFHRFRNMARVLSLGGRGGAVKEIRPRKDKHQSVCKVHVPSVPGLPAYEMRTGQ